MISFWVDLSIDERRRGSPRVAGVDNSGEFQQFYRREGRERASPELTSRRAAMPETKRAKPLLLLADDDPELIGILLKRLQVLECDIITAPDGSAALEAIRRDRPDAVILDVMMPGMNGWEVCKTVKADAALKDTRIMMLTGIGESLNEMTSPIYGADDHIDKPFNFSELLFKIRRLLAGRV
jgi:CheY-like chemotaxis protein